jgi:hypothetical protein
MQLIVTTLGHLIMLLYFVPTKEDVYYSLYPGGTMTLAALLIFEIPKDMKMQDFALKELS